MIFLFDLSYYYLTGPVIVESCGTDVKAVVVTVTQLWEFVAYTVSTVVDQLVSVNVRTGGFGSVVIVVRAPVKIVVVTVDRIGNAAE